MENDISSAHRLKESVIKTQASALGIEHSVGKALFDDYEEIFISNLRSSKE